ncbi:YadA-like family protein [Paraburkholderia sp. A2WS-5]|uniref:YadA family autotransporter adhesin n=1 Tax=Paraburkholderia sp. A2WS-5 TaxID=3028372 RepID=UPI003B790694
MSISDNGMQTVQSGTSSMGGSAGGKGAAASANSLAMVGDGDCNLLTDIDAQKVYGDGLANSYKNGIYGFGVQNAAANYDDLSNAGAGQAGIKGFTSMTAGYVTESGSGVAQTQAYGMNSIAMGCGSHANGLGTVAQGWGAVANGAGAVAFGINSAATGQGSFASGIAATAAGDDSIALGTLATATGNGSIALGANAAAAGENAIASGNGANAEGDNSVAMGAQATASGAGSMAFGESAAASGVNAVASGNGAGAEGDESVAMGSKALASGAGSMAFAAAAAENARNPLFAAYGDKNTEAASASGMNAVAVGVNASATADNSVALGAGSVADRANTVSVGAAGSERQVTNVAAGTAGTDAVNVNQLNDAQKQAENYADQRISQSMSNMSQSLSGLQDLVHDVLRRSYAGTAAAMAVAGLPQPTQPGKMMVAMAGGRYGGQTGGALGVSYVTENNKWVGKLSANTSTTGNTGVVVGAGYQW